MSQSNPTRSPVAAINAGLEATAGSLVGVWIDGARLASPGLIDACMKAKALHPRPVIATINYQIGPGLQCFSAAKGYDQQAEDRLSSSIDWPREGYALFEVSQCEIRGGPTGPMWESNALFLPRSMWAELGGYDPAFVEPGGGVVNADTLIRACDLPNSQLIRVVGEGTFHQFHDGLSTSSPDGASRTMQEGSRAYMRRRGKPLRSERVGAWIYDSRNESLAKL